MRFRFTLTVLCIALVACSAEQAPLIAEHVVIAKPLPGVRMSAGYLTLRNTSAQPIRINRVDSPELASVEMHETVLDEGVSRMRALPEVIIPAHDSVRFAAGQKHLMIRHTANAPNSITLQFYDDETLLLSISVRPEG